MSKYRNVTDSDLASAYYAAFDNNGDSRGIAEEIVRREEAGIWDNTSLEYAAIDAFDETGDC